jgi:hypothetical protein
VEKRNIFHLIFTHLQREKKFHDFEIASLQKTTQNLPDDDYKCIKAKRRQEKRESHKTTLQLKEWNLIQ